MLTEISLYLPNKAGQFHAALVQLADDGVNVLAFSIEQAGVYSTIRLICGNSKKAKDRLSKAGYGLTTAKVFAVRLAHKAGQLMEVTKLLADNGINIEYGYLTLIPSTTNAVVMLKTNNVEKAKAVIKEHGMPDISNVRDLVPRG